MTLGNDVQATAVRISSTSHRVKVVAEDRHDVSVEGDARVGRDGSLVTVDSVQSRLLVRVPRLTDVVVGTTSARVEIEGSAGRVAVVTDSGRVSIEEATAVDVRTESARVEVGRAAEDCCVRTSSGRVEVGECGSADVTTDSSRIELRRAGGPVRAHCVSGRIEVGLTGAGDVDAETVSGRIEVTVPETVHVRHEANQGVHATWPDGSESRVRTRSVTGRVDVSSQ